MSTLLRDDQKYLWHPFTQAASAGRLLPVVSASGAELVLEDGRRIIDGISSWWCNLHGHSHPEVADAIAEQASHLDHVLFAGCTHEPAVELAKGLLGVLPSNQARVFFTDNGSTAVEAALKLAVQYHRNLGHKRTVILALDDAYHGDTFGAMAVGARGLFTEPFEDLMFRVERISTEGTEQDLERCRTLCQSGEVAAFIFEPRVQGVGGMKMYENDVLDRYMAECRRCGVLCISDEVMTGFARTGSLFASSDLAIPPDMITLSKGLTNGTLPLAVTTCSAEVFDAFVSNDFTKTFFHGHTFTANPIACAAARASLRLTKSDACAARRVMIADRFRRAVREFATFDRIENARTTGAILAITVRDSSNAGYGSAIRNLMYDACLARGVLLRPLGNVLYAMPPYCVTSEQIDRLIETMRFAVRSLDS